MSRNGESGNERGKVSTEKPGLSVERCVCSRNDLSNCERSRSSTVRYEKIATSTTATATASADASVRRARKLMARGLRRLEHVTDPRTVWIKRGSPSASVLRRRYPM